ncbi:MAG: sugar phosphate isomerase/epimerase family protein [Phycisphaerae bacterium]
MGDIHCGICSIILPELSPDELIEHVAQAGFEGIEWRVAAPAAAHGPHTYWNNNRATLAPEALAGELPRLMQLAAAHGLATCAISPYYTCLEPASVESVMAAMPAGSGMNVRVTAPNYDASRNYNTQFAAARSGFAHIARLAQRYGVRACLEQHQGSLTPTASACVRMVDGLNPKYIGVIIDPGNTVVEGYENFCMAVEMPGPYLAEVHIKNAMRVKTDNDGRQRWGVKWDSLAAGMADLHELRLALHKNNFSGWLLLEDFSERPATQRLAEGREVMQWLCQPQP